MTKVQANCLKIALNIKNFKLAAQLALAANIEYDNVSNLNNAYCDVQHAMSKIEWRSALAQLAKDGKYSAMGGEFNGDYGYIN